MLNKAIKQAKDLTGDKLDEMNAEIEKLQSELNIAHSKNERAMSMAQQTKSGYVYIISNIGSFGENVAKIGMTRRLDPMDRVKELGDASVPFTFDVHALIYSDNAPALESQLHKLFDEQRLNKVNYRKEFFKVDLDELENKILDICNNAKFIKDVEATEYNETLKILNKIKEDKKSRPGSL